MPWRVGTLVAPDFGAAGYQSYVADILTSWLDHGVAGWRLDSAWSVPAPFWHRVLARVRRAHPDAWFFGHVFDDDLPAGVNAATYPSTEYALMHGTREWLAGGSVEGMAATLSVHAANGPRVAARTFLGNHNLARLADVVDADLLGAAFAVLMTLPGVPVYYGDELGLPSMWTEGSSDAALHPPLAVADATTPPAGDATNLLDTVRRLGAFRRARPWLTRASLGNLRTYREALAYTVRDDGDQALHVHVNPSAVDVRFDNVGGRSILGSGATVTGSSVDLTPRSWAVLG